MNYKVVSDHTAFNFSAKSHKLAIEYSKQTFENFKLYFRPDHLPDTLIYNTEKSFWRKLCSIVFFWR